MNALGVLLFHVGIPLLMLCHTNGLLQEKVDVNTLKPVIYLHQLVDLI